MGTHPVRRHICTYGLVSVVLELGVPLTVRVDEGWASVELYGHRQLNVFGRAIGATYVDPGEPHWEHGLAIACLCVNVKSFG